ncbi:Hsp20/alpha crystallin family protein [Streptomyces buecherae]|uniref:Hsp20/alpha crystallin family protein n=1 Tax=Streptomyces buecherae TaxID=2763006 RepID=UPI001E3BB82C|nr:Hsp20/alpha crystallin family protein [Streptomyces buecherae]
MCPELSRRGVARELNGAELPVHGEIRNRERTGVLRDRARHAGRFRYQVTLPQDTDVEHVTADLTDGVLTAKVSKAGQAKPQCVEITG